MRFVLPQQVAVVFMELYSELGDNIALQYGGSEAHKKVSGGSGGGGKQVQRAVVATRVNFLFFGYCLSFRVSHTLKSATRASVLFPSHVYRGTPSSMFFRAHPMPMSMRRGTVQESRAMLSFRTCRRACAKAVFFAEA